MKTPLVIHADLSDILYEGRNQAYGGYRLRKDSDRTMLSAFAATSAVVLSVLLVLFALRNQPAASLLDEKVILTELNLPPMPLPEPKQPEPPQKQPAALAAPAVKGMDTQASATIKPTTTADLNTTIAPDSSFKDKQPGLTTTNTGQDGPVGGNPDGKNGGCVDCQPGTGKPGDTGSDVALPQPFDVFLGDMPVPLNLDAVRKSISYPQEAKEARLEGKVSYRVLVSAAGTYVRHEVIRSSHPIFDRHCARQLQALRFAPGKMGDRAVPVWVTIPFSFQLNR
jgi:periplasmic protein TonB